MQRILIIENELLLGAGIQHLLAGEDDLEIIGVSSDTKERLVQEINRQRPDVIILDEISRLAHPAILQALLNNAARLQILVISANHNRIRIYSKQEFQLYQAADLHTIIRENKHQDQLSS